MAKISDAPETTDSEQWETINSGSLGNEWDFDQDGPLVGYFLGTRTVPTTKVDSGEATAIQFSLRSDPDEIVFVWESSDLKIFSNTDMFRTGDLTKITYLGRRSFTGSDNKPRQIKQYRVQTPPANRA